jgi:Halobacterial output domain 1
MHDDDYRTTPHQTPTNHAIPLTERVVAAIADANNTSVNDLPPLYEVVNPDALDNLFARTSAGNIRSDGHVTFMYAGYEVTVTHNEVIDIEPLP